MEQTYLNQLLKETTSHHIDVHEKGKEGIFARLGFGSVSRGDYLMADSYLRSLHVLFNLPTESRLVGMRAERHVIEEAIQHARSATKQAPVSLEDVTRQMYVDALPYVKTECFDKPRNPKPVTPAA
jgi:hypothetical protein